MPPQMKHGTKVLSFTNLAGQIHADNVAVGWWDPWPNKQDRFTEARILVVSEMVEALEGARKDLYDDHLPHHKMFDVELADAMIRLLDLAGAYGIGAELMTHRIAQHMKEMHGKRVPAQLDIIVAKLYHPSPAQAVYDGMCSVMAIASLHSINVKPLIDEKRAYNKQRADHKRENRSKPGGKAF